MFSRNAGCILLISTIRPLNRMGGCTFIAARAWPKRPLNQFSPVCPTGHPITAFTTQKQCRPIATVQSWRVRPAGKGAQHLLDQVDSRGAACLSAQAGRANLRSADSVLKLSIRLCGRKGVFSVRSDLLVVQMVLNVK